jgi:AcrR family transcriptional regulator
VSARVVVVREGERGDARSRILDTAYELFSRNGIRGVGIDRIIAESQVAKMTLYHHFASKEELAVGFLELREQRWTRGWLEAGIEARASAPEDRWLVVFDLFDEWFRRPDYEGCSFANTLLEFRDAGDRLHQEAVAHLDVIRELLEGHAELAKLRRPQEAARQMQLLMLGAIVSAGRGDLDAARRARELAKPLLEG